MEHEIFHSCYLGYIDKVKDILENEGNAHIKDSEDNNLIHSAAKHDHYKLIWYLRKKDVSLISKNKYGDTPLHVACKNHSLNSARYILRFMNNIKIKNLEGKTAFDYLNPYEKESMNNFFDKVHGLGKYEYKPKSEVHHFFGAVR